MRTRQICSQIQVLQMQIQIQVRSISQAHRTEAVLPPVFPDFEIYANKFSLTP